MARPRLPDHERLVSTALRISPQAHRRLQSLPTKQKKHVIAAMRKAAELVINSMTGNLLQSVVENLNSDQIKDDFLVD
jgi:hypothetical protein